MARRGTGKLREVRKRRGQRHSRALAVAFGASLVGHGCTLIWLTTRVMPVRVVDATPIVPSPWATALDAPEAVAVVALATEAEALPAPEPPVVAEHEADDARRGPAEPTRAGTPDDRAPAPDRGAATGRPVVEAWRRDRSTLRTRVTDGATVYQIARDRTSSRASSPQAERLLPKPGRADAPATERPGASSPPQPAVEMASAGPSDDARDIDDSARPPTTTPEATGHRRASGGLDVAAGPQRYDAPDLGPARERIDQRQASNEPHPGLMELTAVGSPGPRDGVSGRGVAAAPGATSERSRGAAPVRTGAPEGTASAMNDAAAEERVYTRHFQEIARRVGQTLVFPRRLALRLEQGESIVRFVVRSDGRLGGGVELVKSAGFTEFDDEAMSAVKRAAPFPSIGKQRLVELRVPFQNPMVK